MQGLKAKIDGFASFIRTVKPSYQHYRHCEELVSVLQRVADGELKRVMIFMPPRHSKSETVSRLFSAYYLYRYPERWVGLASYAVELARTLARAARENYQNAGGKLSHDSKAVTHWETSKRGGMWAAGAGGGITGKGAHLAIIDDPLKDAEEAQSQNRRDLLREWYSSTFYTRLEPDASVVVLQTRWHEDDLSGWLLTQETDEEGGSEGWYIVNLSAIAEEPPKFPESCRVHPDWRAKGEALCPDRYTADRLGKIAKRIGEYWFGALYQQRPTAKEGSFFKVGQFRFIDAIDLPSMVQIVRAWDKAATENAGDYTAGVKIGKSADGRFFVLDVVRGQWDTSERNNRIRQTAERDGVGTVVFGEQDPGSAGVDEKRAFLYLLAGFKVHVERASTNKETRADPYSAQVNGGNVWIVRGNWNPAYIEELRAFPTGRNDDQVDGSSGAFNRLAVSELRMF